MTNPAQVSIHSKVATIWCRALAVLVCVVLVSCSGGESGPQPGSPEWNWNAAVENMGLGDFSKADEQIEAITKADGDLAARATLWRAVLLAGLTTGYDDLSNAYVEGQGANEKETTDFQNVINDYRRQTRKYAIALAESTGDIKKAMGSGDNVALEFPLPEGSTIESPILSTVESGRLPRTDGAPSESATLESQTVTRAILHAAAALTGTDDVSQVQSKFSAGSVAASRSDFEVAMARYLLDTSRMFDREGINDPKIRKLIFGMAEKWAEPYLENDDYKDWAEAFEFDVTNENRDIDGKRRILKK